MAYFFVEPGKPLERRPFSIDGVSDDEVVVKVAGCGLCHTDISFLTGQVKTKLAPPIILGHEISGTVSSTGAAFSGLLGKNVIVPAVLPCGECSLCKNGRENICQNQKMPGNDFHGGFASHVVVPGRFVSELPPDLGGFSVSQLSVIADAVTTPYQSLIRSKLQPGDLAIVIGVGGIGIYMVQHAKNAGANVIALDIDEKRLALAQSQGADDVFCVKGVAEKDVKEHIRGVVKARGFASHQWKIFEMSGSLPGQNLGFFLLTFASTLGIVGFTMEKTSVRLSNLMAFDADIFGNWGCRPAYYAPVVKDVLSRKINILDNIVQVPLDDINDVIRKALSHELQKRVILTP